MTTTVQDLHSRYGFHTTPFTREIAVKDRFTLPEHNEAISAMLQTLDGRMSCALIAPLCSDRDDQQGNDHSTQE